MNGKQSSDTLYQIDSISKFNWMMSVTTYAVDHENNSEIVFQNTAREHPTESDEKEYK